MQTIELLNNEHGRPVSLSRVTIDDTACYVMEGPTGEHKLPAHTSAERLAAHWAGFCTMNDVENSAQREANANPKRVPSSYRVRREVARSRMVLAMLETRLDSMDERAERFEATWAEHGDAAHLLDQLLTLIAPDDEAETLREIDRDLGDVFPHIQED